jgi:hypothetical protein
VLQPVPKPDKESLRALKRSAQVIAGKIRNRSGGLQPSYPYSQVVNGYSGKKRTVYENAMRDLASAPSSALDARVNMFIKAEKAWQEPKDPRPIQARNPRHNLELASILKPVEHQVYSLTSFRKEMGCRPDFRKTKIFGKCANAEERARLILDKWDTFKDPICLSLDASRFDAHVDVDVLEVEHQFYLSLCDPKDKHRLNELLQYHKHNKGRTSTGIKYKALGRRMSGDTNTALGNCTLMLLFVFTAMRKLGIKSYDVLDDGDDVLLFLDRKDEDRVLTSLTKIFLGFGQELKVDEVARNPWEISWCQTKLTQRSNGSVAMVRDFRKLLATGGTSHRYYDHVKTGRKVMKSVGTCELYLGRGVPILQEYALMLLREAGDVDLASQFDEALEHRVGLEGGMKKVAEFAAAMPINDACRAAFELTWGITPDQQIQLEDELKAVRIDWSSGMVNLGQLDVVGDRSTRLLPWETSTIAYGVSGRLGPYT